MRRWTACNLSLYGRQFKPYIILHFFVHVFFLPCLLCFHAFADKRQECMLVLWPRQGWYNDHALCRLECGPFLHLSLRFSIIYSFNAKGTVLSIAHCLGKSSAALFSSSLVVIATVTSNVEESSATTTTVGFSSVTASVVSPSATITVESPRETTIAVPSSSSAKTTGSSGAASFTSTALPPAQVSVQATTASTVQPTTNPVNGK